MAYFSSDAPLPQNSLNPPPAWKVAASNRRLYENAMASQSGRERVYADLPDAESFLSEGAGLVVDASYIIPASEMARRSVLNGLVVPATGNPSSGAVGPNGQPISGQTPIVYSLNAPTGQATGASPSFTPQTPTMPQAAPITTGYGYVNPPPTMEIATRPPIVEPSSPGCVKRGLSGYTPPWSDAFAAVADRNCGCNGGSKKGFWIVAAILGAGVLGLANSGKGRFF